MVLRNFEDEIENDDIEILTKQLYAAMDKLPHKGREVFKSIVFDNLKYKEVAEKYNISTNTVKTHYSRALKNLRAAFYSIILVLLH